MFEAPAKLTEQSSLVILPGYYTIQAAASSRLQLIHKTRRNFDKDCVVLANDNYTRERIFALAKHDLAVTVM